LSMGFRRQRFHHPLPSKLHGSAFYHDGTFTRENALPFTGHANFASLTQHLSITRKPIAPILPST
jgi:hypothetical protein